MKIGCGQLAEYRLPEGISTERHGSREVTSRMLHSSSRPQHTLQAIFATLAALPATGRAQQKATTSQPLAIVSSAYFALITTAQPAGASVLITDSARSVVRRSCTMIPSVLTRDTPRTDESYQLRPSRRRHPKHIGSFSP